MRKIVIRQCRYTAQNSLKIRLINQKWYVIISLCHLNCMRIFKNSEEGEKMIIQICVGSSCHIKGSPEIVELFQKAVAEYNLDDEITLAGSFCIGKCNRVGVTVQIDDDIHVGVTKENFKEFFKENVLDILKR